MSHKSDIPDTGRDFYFSPSPAGDNAKSGTSTEVPVADPQTAIERVNALVPPPAADNPASINASVTGTYSTGIVLPEFVTGSCAFASIITFDAVNIICEGRHSIEWGALLNLASGGTCVKIDGVSRLAVEVNAVVPVGENGKGFEVTGECDDIFCLFRQGELQGDGATLLHHTATSPSPTQYNGESCEFFGVNQTFLVYDPNDASVLSVVDVKSVQEGEGEDTSNSTVIKASSGVLAVSANTLSGEVLISTEHEAQVIVVAQAMAGGVNVAGNSMAIIECHGTLTGGIYVSEDALMVSTISILTGDIIVEGGVSLNATILVGDIEVRPGGTLICYVSSHIGTVTNNGTLNGVINGVHYGTWRNDYEDILTSDNTGQVLVSDNTGNILSGVVV